jgi:hypothetical protein
MADTSDWRGACLDQRVDVDVLREVCTDYIRPRPTKYNLSFPRSI